MTDQALENALKYWVPRFVQQGVDLNDYQRTVAKIDSWENWIGPWVALGDMHQALAKEAEGHGNTRTAGEAFLRASLCYHFAKYLWVLDVEKYKTALSASVACMRAAHRYLDASAERIEAALDKEKIVGNLRVPHNSKPPLVLLIPGLDSVKEEFFHWEEFFLSRGMATLSLDGPGQGEAGLALPIRANYETAVSAMLDALSSRKDLDLTRTGIAGVSAGGYYAPRSAAFEPRIKAVCSVGGVFNFFQFWDTYPIMIHQKLLFDTRTTDLSVAKNRVADFDTLKIAPRVKQPFLILHGDNDWAFPLDAVKPIAEAAPNSELTIIPGGNHVCSNYPYLWRPLVADWMRRQLA